MSFCTIALDAMGGDHAPLAVVDGAALFARSNTAVEFLFFGDQKVITPLLKKHRALAQKSRIIHTDIKIGSHERPREAFRVDKKNSSMRLAIEAVKRKEAHCCVSGGNSGALMGLSKVILGTVPGLDRPAMVSTYPTKKGETVMLDLGANLICNAENLRQFAIMGGAYAFSVLGIKEPKIGLINVGIEDTKGNEVIQEAHSLIKATELRGDYVGFIEGDDIAKGQIDVVVTDGFTGNVALKASEGLARLIQAYLRRAFTGSFFGKLAYVFCYVPLKTLRKQLDPRKNNGAVLVGLNGISVKSHGSTDGVGFSYAITVAYNLHKSGFIERIERRLSHLQKVNAEITSLRDKT